MPAGSRGAAIVVGASSGIGAALAVELARTGYRVGLVARREAELEQVRLRCNAAAGGEIAFAHTHDVRDFDDVPALFERLVAELGGLDTILYAAGVMARDLGADEYDFEKDRPVVEVGFLGAIAWLNQAASKFTRQKYGTVCGISSIAGDRGRRAYPSYHATKAALDTFLESLRNRLAPHKASVVTIKPGFIDTAMTQGMEGLFWVISAEQAAKTILKHVRNRRHTRYVPGRWALVGLVIRNIPSFLFRRMKI